MMTDFDSEREYKHLAGAITKMSRNAWKKADPEAAFEKAKQETLQSPPKTPENGAVIQCHEGKDDPRMGTEMGTAIPLECSTSTWPFWPTTHAQLMAMSTHQMFFDPNLKRVHP